MPSGACVIRRNGKRGAVWYAKYRDSAARQVKERLGREADGWTAQRAERELGKRLAAVEKGFRKPRRETVAEFAERFRSDYLAGRNLKPSTLVAYDVDLRCHLLPAFGRLEIGELACRPDLVDGYIAAQRRAGLSAKTIANTLTTLRILFKVAVRWRVVDSNPVLAVDGPRVETPEMNVLDEGEVARLLVAYTELEAKATEQERPWWRLTRRLVVVALGTALRRGELLGLPWRDVKLLDGLLSVRQTVVRGQVQTPKSRASRRTLELGPTTLAALGEQWQETAYRADEDLVFSHPLLGTPLDPSRLSRDFLHPALLRAGIVKPFRPWHDMRHTSLTLEAAAGNPTAYVQLRAGHSQSSITDRYIHAAQVLFPGAAGKGEARIFAGLADTPGTNSGTK